MAEGKVKYAQGRLDKQEDRAAKAAEKNAEIEFRIADRMSSNSVSKIRCRPTDSNFSYESSSYTVRQNCCTRSHTSRKR
jgi:hypothetical protein